MPQSRNRRAVLFFLVYAAVMLWLLFGRSPYSGDASFEKYFLTHINFVPFRTIRRFSRLLTPPVRPVFLRMAVNNLLGNILMFIPLGYYLPSLFVGLRKFWRTLLSTCIIMSLVEVLQLVLTVGTCDIDDLILNTIGSAFGYCIYRLCNRNT